MNIQSKILQDCITELVREQIYLSNQVEISTNQKEVLCHIKELNKVITGLYHLKDLVSMSQKQVKK